MTLNALRASARTMVADMTPPPSQVRPEPSASHTSPRGKPATTETPAWSDMGTARSCWPALQRAPVLSAVFTTKPLPA